MDACIELRAKDGRTTTQTLAFDMVNVRAWDRRNRVVFDAPASIILTYVHLASQPFQKIMKKHVDKNEQSDLLMIGDVGLGLALDERLYPVVSVEAIALLQLMQAEGETDETFEWIEQMKDEWRKGQCLFTVNVNTGWRGFYSEHRIWSAILLIEDAVVKTPYCKPVIRSWFTSEIIQDIKNCVGEETILKVANTIAQHNFDGAPDLVMYHKNPPVLRFIEVKSATDRLSEAQLTMIKHLQQIPLVECQICGSPSALKRCAKIMTFDFSDSSE